MTKCEVCGNEYDEPLQVTLRGKTHFFDSFECAIHALAPKCNHCGCRIVGHGLQVGDKMFCCAHCARGAGDNSLKDRADAAAA